MVALDLVERVRICLGIAVDERALRSQLHFEAKSPVAGLHNAILRVPPVVAPPTPDHPARPEAAIFLLNWLSATGTGILAAAIMAGIVMGFNFGKMLRIYGMTLWRVALLR